MGHFLFELLHGEPTPLPVNHALLLYKKFLGKKKVSHIQRLVNEAKINIEISQDQQKCYYYKHYIVATFKVGDFVFLTICNLWLPVSKRLSPHFVGPCKILA